MPGAADLAGADPVIHPTSGSQAASIDVSGTAAMRSWARPGRLKINRTELAALAALATPIPEMPHATPSGAPPCRSARSAAQPSECHRSHSRCIGGTARVLFKPNQASVEQLTGLPPTYLCVDEADPLRDEGEAYAAKLRSADVPVTTVRYDGIIHDFMLLNALSQTRATRAAIDQATAFLRAGLGTG